MKIKLTIVWLSLLFSPLLLSCPYNGDGEYYASGTWPLKNYSLTLPEFEVQNGTVKEYNLANFKGHEKVWLKLILKSDNNISFIDTNILMSFAIIDKKGNTLLRMNNDLFKHMHRMQASGKTMWENDDEWHCRFRYRDIPVNRAVAFSSDENPIKQSELICRTRINKPPSNSKIILNVEKVDPGYNLKAALKLSSGWK